MKKLFESETARYLFFFVAVLASRLPFLHSGYGIDGDSWSVALSAKNISHSGMYEASRLPGNPVQEFICALFFNQGVSIVNFLTALISTIGFFFFALTLRDLKFKYPLLGATTLAFVPVVYIHSTTTIDYNWALTFILICFYFVVKHKPIAAAIFLGIAIGCRITSGAMLLPMAIMLVENDTRKQNIKRILVFAILTCVTGALFYLPAFLRYGFSFFTYYDVPYPSIPKVLYKFFVEVWGTLGFIGIIIATGLLFLPDRITAKKYLFPRSVNEKYVVAWLVAIDLYIIAFLKLPMESGYLIPIIPFVILIFGKYLYNKAFIFFACVIILSSFVGGLSPVERKDAPTESALTFHFTSGNEKLMLDILKGPVLAYQSRRENGIKFTSECLTDFDTISKNTLLISGRWYNQMLLTKKDSSNKFIVYRDYVNQDTLLYYIGKNYEVYYLPKQDFFNQLKYGIDIAAYGAIPFFKEK